MLACSLMPFFIEKLIACWIFPPQRQHFLYAPCYFFSFFIHDAMGAHFTSNFMRYKIVLLIIYFDVTWSKKHNVLRYLGFYLGFTCF